ncbi:MAG: cytochrome c oxidase subunit 2A [Bacillota bacterium]|jgi:hypothetical protein
MRSTQTSPQLDKRETPLIQEEGQTLKGTFVFALGLGAFILLSWLSVFFLYLSR